MALPGVAPCTSRCRAHRRREELPRELPEARPAARPLVRSRPAEDKGSAQQDPVVFPKAIQPPPSSFPPCWSVRSRRSDLRGVRLHLAVPRPVLNRTTDLLRFSRLQELNGLLSAVSKPVFEFVDYLFYNTAGKLSTVMNGDRQTLSGGPHQDKVRATLSFFLEANPPEPTYHLPCREKR